MKDIIKALLLEYTMTGHAESQQKYRFMEVDNIDVLLSFNSSNVMRASSNYDREFHRFLSSLSGIKSGCRLSVNWNTFSIKIGEIPVEENVKGIIDDKIEYLRNDYIISDPSNVYFIYLLTLKPENDYRKYLTDTKCRLQYENLDKFIRNGLLKFSFGIQSPKIDEKTKERIPGKFTYTVGTHVVAVVKDNDIKTVMLRKSNLETEKFRQEKEQYQYPYRAKTLLFLYDNIRNAVIPANREYVVKERLPHYGINEVIPYNKEEYDKYFSDKRQLKLGELIPEPLKTEPEISPEPEVSPDPEVSAEPEMTTEPSATEPEMPTEPSQEQPSEPEKAIEPSITKPERKRRTLDDYQRELSKQEKILDAYDEKMGRLYDHLVSNKNMYAVLSRTNDPKYSGMLEKMRIRNRRIYFEIRQLEQIRRSKWQIVMKLKKKVENLIDQQSNI